MPQIEFPIRGDLLKLSLSAGEQVAHVVTDYQTIDIWETEVFGKILFLDGHIQLAELDEHAYHEALVRIPMLNLPEAKAALVVGGGDGGVLRELCRFSKLERIEIVEIDEKVIATCREHMPAVSGGAFADPRVRLTVGDAFDFVRRRSAAFDLIVLDSTDTYEEESGELSEALFTREFYADCRAALQPGGVVVTQADNPVFCPYSLVAIEQQLGEVFEQVGSYLGLVPSFGGYSAFSYAGTGAPLARRWQENWAPARYLTEATYNLAFAKPSLTR